MTRPTPRYLPPQRLLSLAVALLFASTAGAVRAQESTEEKNDTPNVFEVGVRDVDRASAKFGEYNGLNKQRGVASADFFVRGADKAESAYRWKIWGTNLGLDIQALGADVGAQGHWRLLAGYEETVRNFTDSYKTLWRGAGGTEFTLPVGYPAAASRLSATNTVGNILANWNNIQAPNATATTTGGGPGYVIPANMQSVDIGTQRKRLDLAMSLQLAPGWEFKAALKRENKEGTKFTGVNIGRFAGISAYLPEPIDSNTAQLEASIGYQSTDASFSLGYYASVYRNDVGLWTVENPGANNAVMNNVARLQSYPDNEMQQFNLSGALRLGAGTRLAVSGSWARLTQDEAFIASPAGSTWVVPAASADAKVINRSFLVRLASRLAHSFTVNASYKYEDRDNRTPIRNFLTTGGDSPGTSTQFTNEPVTRNVRQFVLDGDLSLGQGRAVKLEFDDQRIHRSAAGLYTPFRADTTDERTARLEFRQTLDDFITGRLSYAYSRRHVSAYEEGDPRPTNPPAPLPAADPLLTGFEQFFLADRNRNKLRGQLNVQASETVSIQGSLDYNRDRYLPEYGLKETKSLVYGLDVAAAMSETTSLTGFVTVEDMKSRLESLAIARGLTTTTLVPHVSGPPCAAYTNVANTLPTDYYTDPCRQWMQSQADKITTIGLNLQARQLLDGRLDVTGELSYSKARTPIAVTGGTYYSTGVPSSPTGNVYIPAESFNDITNELTQLRLSGTYRLDKQSALRLTYTHARLKSSDWQYDAYSQSALGVLAIQSYLGPGMVSPNYNVNIFGLSYLYRFR